MINRQTFYEVHLRDLSCFNGYIKLTRIFKKKQYKLHFIVSHDISKME